MDVLAQLLIAIHIVAVVAGGSNAVLNTFAGPLMKDASMETRQVLYILQDKFALVGKISTGVLILSGLLALWLKWQFTPPSAWFWVKMAGFAGMIAFIALAERETAAARSGGPQAGPAIAAKMLYGKLTSLAFLVVIISVVLTFR